MLRGVDEESDEQCNDDNVEDVEERVRVNNTVVDNELGGRDVTVLPSLKRVWNGIKKREFAPHKWLVTDQAKLSTVRWSSAYLCGMGDNWGAPNSFLGNSRKNLATFFSNEMRKTRGYLQRVTWKIEENNRIQMVFVSTLGDKYIRTNLNGEMKTAYGTEICGFDLQKEMSRTWSEHPSLPSSHVLIMLFLMGFPGVELEDDYDDQVVSSES